MIGCDRQDALRGVLAAALWLAGAGLAAQAGEADTASIPGIAFVGGAVVDRLDDEYAGSYHWRDGYVYPRGATYNAWERTVSTPRPGRNLFTLTPARPDGKLTQLTFLKDGNVWDPEPSFDGEKLLFSMRKDGEDWYHLFEINIDGSDLRQLTDGPFNDISGTYLPDGRIVFCSDRSGTLDEYHEERSEFLFRMNADGSGIEQLTFVPGIYFEPTVLQNGLILCSFWDAFHISVAPFIKHETYLITLRPDGTEERHFFGAGQYKFYNRTRHSAIGLTRPGELPDGRILLQSEMGPSIYDPNLGTDLATALAPVFPGTASVQTGGTTHAIHMSPLGTRSSAYPLQDGRFLMSATLPGSRDLGIYVVDPASRSMEPIYDRMNLSEWDAVPIAVARSRPKAIPDKQRDAASEMATFIISAGRHSDTPERNALNARARFVRVLQAEYTDVTTSSHTSLETRVLGTVPLLPDGSIAFEAPAETPLFLETLDARGNRLVLQAGYMAARAGETKSCTGCHAPQTEAVANAKLQALERPVTRITRDSSDLSYRRNDPEEYRRQAIITQGPVYRKWLSSELPELRQRGLEMLAYLPDEVLPSDRARFVELLNDKSPEVQRQAALTLAMVGTAEEIAGLVAALDGAAREESRPEGARPPLPPLPKGGRVLLDWQATHYVLMALEAITGENLELAADLERGPAVWKTWWQEVGSVGNFLTRLSARGDRLPSAFERDAWLEAVARTGWLADPAARAIAGTQRPLWLERVRQALQFKPTPPLAAIRAAGLLGDADALALLTPLLLRGGLATREESCPDCDDALERETRGTLLAKEAAIALGRIGGQPAIDPLWEMLSKTVPNPAPIASRHYQTGPRPEEYTYLRALIYAGAKPAPEQVPYLVALLPYTEGEKPRFEDRTKTDSQRVWLGRVLLERAGLRGSILSLSTKLLRGEANPSDPLYQHVLRGMNIDRPRSEHGREFPVLKELSAEQALHLLASLAQSADEIPEPLVAARLRSASHRERIEAAVIFRKFGYSRETEQILRDEASKPYPFGEIWSIGKGRPDTQFRDKAYFLMALGAHARDLDALNIFTDYTKFYRDIRIGLAIGLGFRGTPNSVPLLTKLAGDPIFSVHRECANALVEIRGAELVAGREFVAAALPARVPLKPEYVTPGAYTFAERNSDPLVDPGQFSFDADDPQIVVRALQAAIDSKAYRNLNNAHARNADRMRVVDGTAIARVLELPIAKSAPLSPELEQALIAALESPYPFAHYLAARLIALREERAFVPRLLKQLPAYVAAGDTIGFHWAADTLGRLRATEAIEALLPYATDKTFDRTFGSVGMAYGFAAARAIGLIAGDMQQAEVARLLSRENPWLRAGVIDGLAERGDRQMVARLEALLSGSTSALVEAETQYALRRLAEKGARK